ncbi:hypothetical protein H112_07045 [Trichophyton rubrum D6]|uniref:Uncharacterized protein n=2 Tax=Trichophyton rubrum TaxID=5551 RepID=A0A080WHN2_TRIRC|nr:uncharacterized protein TERG_11840 [Trichophyton rubrum CBS 118892]EZF11818.1 hypothetical protein H100_07068 [Trichophyton rubrum MR850]EZF38713.1 hypothetical protein H102_07031 [Trichophyton rubrum CBS 100081]EZF49346.1 hypothetical protein H103_07052 [Trichophyton rubrum CBS 288.86]EZF59961.1 hypothetical protein H104_07008 [Trichophyton rubrum CBS 289.86]EZF81276.1 hypothetical protein H110_07049 [Trichophyton rubrum MR1448]EZF91916.1 hypothetical protein H113_07103 [Trichophyton rubr
MQNGGLLLDLTSIRVLGRRTAASAHLMHSNYNNLSVILLLGSLTKSAPLASRSWPGTSAPWAVVSSCHFTSTSEIGSCSVGKSSGSQASIADPGRAKASTTRISKTINSQTCISNPHPRMREKEKGSMAYEKSQDS